MAPRIGFTLRALREMHPAACSSDARLVWKKGDCGICGIVTADGMHHQIGSLSSRELRLLGTQMIEHANNRERDGEPFEEVLP